MARHHSPPGRFEYIEELISLGLDWAEIYQSVERNEPRWLPRAKRDKKYRATPEELSVRLIGDLQARHFQEREQRAKK